MMAQIVPRLRRLFSPTLDVLAMHYVSAIVLRSNSYHFLLAGIDRNMSSVARRRGTCTSPAAQNQENRQNQRGSPVSLHPETEKQGLLLTPMADICNG